MVSPESAEAGCEGLGAFTTPLVFWFAERWVIGFVPCHALGCVGFLERFRSQQRVNERKGKRC